MYINEKQRHVSIASWLRIHYDDIRGSWFESCLGLKCTFHRKKKLNLKKSIRFPSFLFEIINHLRQLLLYKIEQLLLQMW